MSTQLETPEPEPETIAELLEFYKSRNYNNFYLRLCDDSLYRQMAKKRPAALKLFSDLDLKAAQLGIDTTAVFDEMVRGHTKVSQAIRAMSQLGDTSDCQLLNAEGEALRQSAHQKMIPLFEALVALGYHPNELVR